MANILLYDNFCRIEDESDVEFLQELDKELSFFVQGAEHTRAFKGYIGRGGKFIKWDGRKRLLSNRLEFGPGLLDRVKKIYGVAEKECNIVDRRAPSSKGKPIKIKSKLKKIKKEPYPYQVDAVEEILKHQRGIIRVATGGGKCSSIDSLHITEYGILDYSELLGDIKLKPQEAYKMEHKLATPLTKDKTDSSSMIYYDGYGDSYKITNNYGYELTATPNHKIQIINNNGDMVWRQCSELKINDYTVVCPDTNLFGKNEMPLNEAYWYGLLIGDGSFVSDNIITLTNMDDHIIKFAENYATDNSLKLYNKKTKSKAHDLKIYNKKYRSELRDLGFDYCKSINKSLPVSLRKLSKKPLSRVIRGIYETDGWVQDDKNKPLICVGLSSKKLIDQLHLILLNFGIVSSRRVKKTTHEDSHILTIYREFIPKFIEEIGFDPEGHKYKKIMNIMSSLDIATNGNSNVVPNQNIKLLKILNIIKRIYKNNSEFFKDAPYNYQTVRSWSGKAWRNPNRQSLLKVLIWTKDKLSKNNSDTAKEGVKLIDSMLLLCEDNLFFSPIKNITKTKSENYDFVVPNTHSFVSQGFVNHNTLIAGLITASLGKKTIIYVIGKDLLYQIHGLFSSLFGKVGIIGDGKCEIHDINVATIWTIGQAIGLKVKRSQEELDGEKKISKKKYNEILDLMNEARVHIFDECHLAACDTIQEIAKHIKPEHMYGMSASPWRDDGGDLLIESILGDTVVNISASYLIERDYLVQPIIKFVPVPPLDGLPKQYQSIYKKYVVDNEERNELVAKGAESLVNLGYQTLVLYNSLEHGNTLFEKISSRVPCAILSGKDSSEERDAVKEQLERGEIKCIVASRIFDIGVDLPSLSGLIIASSGKSSVRALQRIGRVIRKYPGKKQSAIIDFYDQAKFLDKHSLARRRIYKSEERFDVRWPQQKRKSAK